MGPWAWLVIVAVMISAASSTQTTILPTARGTLSMAVHKALPDRFGKVHAKYLTPTFSTVLMGAVSIVFYVGMTLISENLLADSIAALGLYIAFYYGITAFACVWFFRATLKDSARNLFMRGLLPLAGGVMMAVAFVYSAFDMTAPDYGMTQFAGVGGTFLLGVGSLLLGVVLMALWYSKSSRREAAAKDIKDSDLVI
jgi:amino acid transporter